MLDDVEVFDVKSAVFSTRTELSFDNIVAHADDLFACLALRTPKSSLFASSSLIRLAATTKEVQTFQQHPIPSGRTQLRALCAADALGGL